MANTKRVQFRRGTDAEHQVFTGAPGEITVNTSKDIAVVHDGVTPGGHELVGIAATGQTLVNKDGVGIGTTLAESALTVEGDARISGIVTIGEKIVVGYAQTEETLVLDANGIKVSGMVSIGGTLGQIYVDGDFQKIYGQYETIDLSYSGVSTFSNLDIIGVGQTSYEAVYFIGRNASIGSTVVGFGTTAGLQLGDFVSIAGILTDVKITGFSTISLDSFEDVVRSVTSVSKDVSVGSTIIGIANSFGVSAASTVSFGSSITIDGAFTNVPVTGITTIAIAPREVISKVEPLSVNLSSGSTAIGIANTIGLTLDNALSLYGSYQNYSNLASSPTSVSGETIQLQNVISSTHSDYITFSTGLIAPSNLYLTKYVGGGNTPMLIEFKEGTSYSTNGDPLFSVEVYSESVGDDLLTYGETFLIESNKSYTIRISKTGDNAEYVLSSDSSYYGSSTTPTFDRVQIVGFSTIPSPVGVDVLIDTIELTTEFNPGETRIHVSNNDNVSIGNSITISDILTTVPVTGIGSLFSGYSYNEEFTTSIVSQSSIGSTSIFISGFDIGNVAIGQSFTIDEVTGISEYFSVVGVTTDAVLIPQSQALQVVVNPGLAATFFSISENYEPYIDISSDDSPTEQINLPSDILVTDFRFESPAVLISSGSASTLTAVVGTGVSFTEYVPQSSPAVIIGSANTSSSAVSIGSTVTVTDNVNYLNAIQIGVANSLTENVSAGLTASILRIDPPKTNLKVNNIHAVGITTIENLILGSLKFPNTDGRKGQVLLTDGQGNVGFGTGGGSGGSEVVLRVSAQTGDDENDGKILPVRTIKRATQLASKVGRPVTIFVETGEYVEDNPIIVYDDVSVIGDSLRNIVVRPLNSGKDLFKVRNGCYVTGMSFNDYVDDITGAPQHTYNYAVAFDDPYDTLIDRTGYACTSVLNITGLTYDKATGITTITTEIPHELNRANTVRLAGIAMTCGYDEVGISTFEYDHISGVSTVTLFSDRLHTEVGPAVQQKGYKIGDQIYLNNLPFACSEVHAGVTTTIFPDGTSEYGYVFDITGINTAAKTVTFNAGVSTIPHIYVGYQHLGISTFEYDHVSGVATATTKEAHGFIGNDRITLENLNLSCGGYTENAQVNITNVVYNEVTGIVTVTTDSDHRATVDKEVKLAGIEFSCDSEHAGVTSTTFPYPGSSTFAVGSSYDRFVVTKVNSATEFEFNAGISTIAHTYVSGGTAQAGITTTLFPDGTSLSVSSDGYTFRVSAATTNTFSFNAGISTIAHTFEGFGAASVSSFVYTESTGVSTCVTSSNHGLTIGDYVTLDGLEFSCSAEHAGITTTIFPDGTSPYGYTFLVTDVADSTTFTINSGISTIAHTYVSGGTAQRVGTTRKVPTVQESWSYPEKLSSGRVDFGVVKAIDEFTFTVKGEIFDGANFEHYYTQGGTARLSKPIINKSPYIQNCSILSSLGGNGILVDGDKVADINQGIIPELGEIPVVGDQPEFGKSMVAATFTMISFGGIGWRTINDGYAQVVSCFQIFCRYGSLTQSGGYLSITNSATNFGDKALRATGFSRKSFVFDRGRVVDNGTQDGLQTLRVVGLGRSDQELYVLRFLDNDGIDRTANFKPLIEFKEFTFSNVNTETDTFNIPAHPFINGESVVYKGNEDANPDEILGGLVNEASYYVEYIDASNFRLYEDEGLQTLVDLSGSFTGINTFTKNNQEFFNNEIIESHNFYQRLSLASTTGTFVSGRVVTQGTATGYAITHTAGELILSVEEIGGVRTLFNTLSNISDHAPSPASIGVSTVVGITTYWTLNFKVDSTTSGNLVSSINTLTENYKCHFHRPSIINSSAHTWEYSGSGTDYNALPENGGQGKANSEQVSELGGRVYASGTNELGDFKIGDQITAFNRTGNIIFNNKVTIGELASIRLSLSGGVAVDEFSTDVGLGQNEPGGPSNSRVSTQLAVRSFLSNRLGSFIDKQVSTNAIPNAVVQLNAQGQINADLIPPQVVTYNLTNVGGGKTVLVNQIPAVNVKQGDTVVEPDDSFVLVNDVLSQYLILDNSTANYTFSNGDEITSSLNESVTATVTSPPNGIGIGTQVQDYVGYGATGLAKGVLLGLTITNAGGGYANPGIYTAITANTLTGDGSGALVTVTIGAGNDATFISPFAGGKGYAIGDVISVSDSDVGGRSGGSQLQATINSVETRLYVDLTNNQKFAGSVALPDYISDGQALSISTSLTSNYTVDIDPSDTSTGGSVDFAEDRIVVGSGHNFGSGDPVIYDANTGSMITAAGNGILNRNTYYTQPVGVSSVELYYDYALQNKVNFTGSGIGTHTIRRDVVNVNTDKIVFVNHGYATGDPFRVFGSAPTGITTHEFYFIGAITTNSFSLHETQADALLSVGGVSFNPVSIAATSVGIMTMTNQNIRYSNVVNTSSQDENNYSLLARDSIDASNIVSGIVASTRLGIGAANNETFLNGSSEYKKVITSIGINTTAPITISATSEILAANGIGVNTYFGDLNINVNKVLTSAIDDYSSLGVSRFKLSTFNIGNDGEITLKPGTQGDIDANALQGQAGAYYLDAANHTGFVPITRGGTGLTGVPGNGAILIGNGSAFNLTTAPTFSGNVGFNGNVDIFNAVSGSGLLLQGSSPTICFQDTDHRTGYIHVNSNIFYILGGAANAGRGAWAQPNGYWPLQIDLTNNNAQFGGNVTVISDIRGKINIEDISNALDRVLNMRGVFYNRKGTGIRETGVIAQELKEVLPEVVVENNEGHFAVAYGQMVGVLIEAIKEQQKQIEDLKSSIEEIKSQLDK